MFEQTTQLDTHNVIFILNPWVANLIKEILTTSDFLETFMRVF